MNAQSIHKKILEVAEVSARSHEEMMSLVGKLRDVKMQADEAHKMYLQTRAEAEKVEQEVVNKILEKKKLQNEVFGNEDAERARKSKALVEKLTESGSAKLNQGKKLSFEEFKALMDQKKI